MIAWWTVGRGHLGDGVHFMMGGVWIEIVIIVGCDIIECGVGQIG